MSGEPVAVIGIEDIVRARDVVLFERFQCQVFLIGRIDRERVHLEVTPAVHAVGGHEFRQFRDAGDAGGRPEIDQPVVFRFVGSELLQPGFIDFFEFDRFGVPFLDRFLFFVGRRRTDGLDDFIDGTFRLVR